ncbi:MAG: CoA transferase [Proteobacteria bacterium]|nr:CoA transferase [Pseudomonadota bacterium]
MGTSSLFDEISTRCLIDVEVVEDFDQSTSELVRQTLRFAGRLAVDCGARVYESPAPLSNADSPMNIFLSEGKRPLSEAPAHALVLTHNPALSTHCVVVSVRPRDDSAQDCPDTDLTMQARSGLCHLIGDPDHEPLKIGGHQVVSAGGYAAFSALVALCLKKARLSVTDRAEVNLLGVMTWVNWKAVALGALGKELKREGAQAEWPVFRLRDGHAAMVFFEPQWDTVCDLIGDTRLRDERLRTFQDRESNRDLYQGIIANWFSTRTKAEVTRLMDANHIPNGVVATPEDLLRDPLVLHRGGMSSGVSSTGRPYSRPRLPHRVYRVASERKASRPAMPKSVASSSTTLPLQGLRVIDLGVITAGAGAGALLADLGADVIKVESTTYADPFRSWAGSEKGDSPLFKFNNRNKRGVALDLKTPAGREAFLQLVHESDLVMENFPPRRARSVEHRLRCATRCQPRHRARVPDRPGLDGPGSENVSFGSSLEARSGIASVTRSFDGTPFVSGRNLNYPDQIVCLHAAGAIMAALLRQTRERGALHLDISQRDVAIYTLSDRVLAASMGDPVYAEFRQPRSVLRVSEYLQVPRRPLVGSVGATRSLRGRPFRDGPRRPRTTPSLDRTDAGRGSPRHPVWHRGLMREVQHRDRAGTGPEYGYGLCLHPLALRRARQGLSLPVGGLPDVRDARQSRSRRAQPGDRPRCLIWQTYEPRSRRP